MTLEEIVDGWMTNVVVPALISLRHGGGRWMVVDDHGIVNRFRQKSAARRFQQKLRAVGAGSFLRRWRRDRVAFDPDRREWFTYNNRGRF